MNHHLVLVVLVITLGRQAYPEDWPQWRGSHRNGRSSEQDWFENWPTNGTPRVAWRTQVGKGHACISLQQGRAFTVGWDGQKDTVHCLSATNGQLLWKQNYPCRDIVQWPGPRATPTIEGQTAYTLGQHGQLRAWNVADGTPRWQTQLPESYQPDRDYGFAWSPLIEGDLLILGGGTAGLALHKRDGTYAWGNDRQPGACSSPVPFLKDNQRGAAVVSVTNGRNSVRIVGVNAQTGQKWFASPDWPEKWGAACADVVVAGASFFLSTAEQHKMCARFTLKAGQLQQDWANRALSTYTSVPVLVGEYLYGVDKAGILKCVDWNTGKEQWAQRGFDHRGALISACDKLIVLSGSGNWLTVAAATPAGYRELRKVRVFQGEAITFTAPVLANDRLYCRSYAGEVVCFDLSRRK